MHNIHPKLLTWETRLALLASLALVGVAISTLLAFRYNRPGWWLAVKLTTGIAAGCAVALVVINILILPG
jgi:Kef-type K+ transport system membrane component KefB